jgi:hypothetical protein
VQVTENLSVYWSETYPKLKHELRRNILDEPNHENIPPPGKLEAEWLKIERATEASQNRYTGA